jgi:hypothetical protein
VGATYFTTPLVSAGHALQADKRTRQFNLAHMAHAVLI